MPPPPRAAFCHGPLLPLSPSAPSTRRPSKHAPRCSAQRDDANAPAPAPVARPVSTSRRWFLMQLLAVPFLPGAIGSAFADDATPLPSSSPASQPVPPAPTPPPAPVGPAKWSYAAPTGPANWADLSADYATAATGQRQSPVALSYRSAVTAPTTARPVLRTSPASFTLRLALPPGAATASLALEPYIPASPPVIGDAPPLDAPPPPPPPSALITYDGVTYALRAVHPHSPSSEHVIDNVGGVAEFHLVFDRRAAPKPKPPPPPPPPSPPPSTDPPSSTSSTSSSVSSASAQPPSDTNTDNNSFLSPAPAAAATAASLEDVAKPNTLVVAVLAQRAAKSEPWLVNLLDTYRDKAGPDPSKAGVLVPEFDVGATVLSQFASSDVFVYDGSLTTPPCTEGVLWMVLRSKCAVAQAEIDYITTLQGGRNVRPVQPLNDRKVKRFLPDLLGATQPDAVNKS